MRRIDAHNKPADDFTIVVTNFMPSAPFPYEERLSLFAKCLRSVDECRKQGNLELIVIDNASKVSVTPIVHIHNVDVYVRFRCNMGIWYAKNFAATIATRKYIGFIDSDFQLRSTCFTPIRDILAARKRTVVNVWTDQRFALNAIKRDDPPRLITNEMAEGSVFYDRDAYRKSGMPRWSKRAFKDFKSRLKKLDWELVFTTESHAINHIGPKTYSNQGPWPDEGTYPGRCQFGEGY